MPTTPRGIWTPSDSDDWDLTVDLAAMAVSIDDAITSAAQADTGWVALTPASGFTAGGGFGYRKIGPAVYLRGWVTGSLTTSEVTITTLPAGARPSQVTIAPSLSTSPGIATSIRIVTDGTITARALTGTSGTTLLAPTSFATA